MNFLGVIKRSFHVKLTAMVSAVVCLVAFLSVLLFYLAINQSLGENYAEKIRTLSIYKLEIIRQSMLIFAGFSILALAGIIFFAILYTHRIAGPLFRIRTLAGELAAGNFALVARFRKRDAIHPLAESLNRFAEEQGKRHAAIRSCIDEMRESAGELKDSISSSDPDKAAAARIKVMEKTNELDKLLSGIKV